MQPVRLLSKLSIRTLNLNGTGGGNGSDIIDWRTAAHALVGLPQCQTNWAYYRFVGDESRLNKVVRSLTMQITLFNKIKQFKIKPETVNGLVLAAVYEYTQPICGVCDGSGLVRPDKPETRCPKCHGVGRKVLSDRSRCKIIGINHKSYSNTHDEVTKELLRLISEWESDIFRNIREKIGGH